MPGRPLGGSDLRIEGRLRGIGAGIVAVFALFVLRLFQLQVIDGEELRLRSEQNSIRTVRLRAPRGEIVDREGRVLATTRPAFALQVVPSALRHPDLTWAALGQLLGRDPADLAERLGNPRGAARFRPVSLVDDLDIDSLSRVETHRYALPGVVTDVEPRRFYPAGPLAAHLLGSIGEIRADQIESPDYADYQPGDVVGQSGLELRLEPHLHGHDGGRNVVVDAAGRSVEVLDEVSPVPGDRVVLALDLDLQRAVEEAFDDTAPGEPPKRGAAVALDVDTGDVLALVSRPAYDPNAFAGGIDTASWEALKDDPWHPLQDRAVQNHYPPGSTHKALVAAALLQEQVIGPQTRTFCPGYFRYGRRTYRCWKRAGHGWMNVRQALQQSCDVFFYTWGVQLGIDRLAQVLRSFGLGRRTGIALPGEAPGLVPASEWKARRFGEPWYPGETVSAAIGQGYNLYTPIQLAVAYAALGNGGRVLQPRIWLRAESRDGVAQEQRAPRVVGRTGVRPEVLRAVLDGLEAAVEERGGTGGRARVPGLRVAGKTGTAQVVHLDRTEGRKEDEVPVRHRDHAWFAALAPADHPAIVVAVFVEHGRHGSSAAAPIAQRVLARWHEKRQAEALRVAGGAS